MKLLYLTLFSILGLIMGSFYNMIAFRLSNNTSIIKPKRSKCMECSHELKAVDLIPIFSYIFLKGKCRYCNKKISIFYPIGELITCILFAVSFYSFNFSYELIMAILLSSLFVIVLITDLNYYIIPDQVTIAFGILILITNVLNLGFKDALIYLVYGAGMFIFMYLIMLLGNFMFKKESLGGGDIKLLFILGMVFPIVLSFTSLMLGVLLALPISIFLLVKCKDKAVPLGPFLIAGFLIVYFLKIDINTIKDLLIIK